MKISFVLLCLAVGIGACSSSDAPPDPYASVASFCESWASSACNETVVLACSGADKADSTLTQACITSQTAFCQTGLDIPATGYSSKNALACLTAVQSAYSDGKLNAQEIATVRHRGSPCNQLIKGAAAEGEPCTKDDDCNTLDDYLCLMKAGTGTCQIPSVSANGDPCTAAGATCNPGYYCDDNCVKSKVEGAKCTESFECAAGLTCDAATTKCVAIVSSGNCTVDSDCALGKICDAGLCVASITLGASNEICKDLR